MTATDTVPYIARDMVAYIEERLLSGKYKPDTRLPSIRQFATKFDIGYGSAIRGIDYLCSRGFLEKRPNSGVYVRQKSEMYIPGKNLNLVYFARNEGNSFTMCYTSLLSIQKKCLEKKHTLSVVSLPDANQAETMHIIQHQSENADGIILFHEYDAHIHDYTVKLPTVGVMMSNSFSGAISTVNIDPLLIAEQATDYFGRHGFKKVRVIYSDYPIYLERALIFQAFAQNRGIDCQLTKYGESFRYNSNTGYYFTSDQTLQWHSEEFRKTHKKLLSGEYCVLGTDGKRELDPDFDLFPTIVADWGKIGEVALEECLSRINHPGSTPKRIYLPGHLKEY